MQYGHAGRFDCGQTMFVACNHPACPMNALTIQLGVKPECIYHSASGEATTALLEALPPTKPPRQDSPCAIPHASEP